jgi:hypothetical protein
MFLKRIIISDETWVYGNENAIFTMGWKKFTGIEKGAAGQVERESHIKVLILRLMMMCIVDFYVRDKR